MTRMRSLVRIQYLPPFNFNKAMTEEIATQAKRKKSLVEWIIIIGLGTLFAVIWFYAHWNLSRQPPHHKGPGAVDQPGKTSTQP